MQSSIHGERIPAALQDRYREITALTDALCAKHLTDEYRDLCRRLVATLSRKRSSPLAAGPARSWACGAACAIGRINFLFDRSQKPHLRADALCQHFGLSRRTGSTRSSAILNLLEIRLLDPRWSRPSQLASNPLAWLIEMDCLIVDARHIPRELQEEAFRQGAIPFIPDC
jgi:AraC-like DNA-binding protein